MECRYHIAAFQTTTAAMGAEARLRREGLTFAIMPTPQSVEASCGLSLRFSPELTGQIDHLLAETVGTALYRLYEAVREDGRTRYRPLPYPGK